MGRSAYRGLLLAIAAAVALAACGENPPAAGNPPPPVAATSSPALPALTGVPSPGPPPVASRATFSLLAARPPAGFTSAVRCSAAIGASDAMAIVQLRDGSLALRDYASADHPFTACTIGTTQSSLVAQLVDSRHLVISYPGSSCTFYAVVDLPAVTYHWFQLPGCGTPSAADLLAVSPGLDTVASTANDQAGGLDELHLTTAAGSQAAATLPDPGSGRCGSPDDSKPAAYTNSGSHLFWLDRANPAYGGLVVLAGGQGVLRISAPAAGWGAAGPKMAVWAPASETLYYAWAKDVWRWTPQQGAQRFLTGVSWYYPTISADGRYLAYATVDAAGLHTVYLDDLYAGTAPRAIGAGHRDLPVFLNSTQLWYRTEGQGVCGPGGDQPRVYDVTDGSESASLVQMPVAVWPATSSNF